MTCSTGKRCYSSRAEAKRVQRALRRQRGIRVKHVYRCARCKEWHLTSMTASGGTSGRCDRCEAPVLWVQLVSGLVPVDPAEVVPQVAGDVVAFQPRDGSGHRLRMRSEGYCVGLAEQGKTFHLCHFGTCPVRAEFRARQGREFRSAPPAPGLGGAMTVVEEPDQGSSRTVCVRGVKGNGRPGGR